MQRATQCRLRMEHSHTYDSLEGVWVWCTVLLFKDRGLQLRLGWLRIRNQSKSDTKHALDSHIPHIVHRMLSRVTALASERLYRDAHIFPAIVVL